VDWSSPSTQRKSDRIAGSSSNDDGPDGGSIFWWPESQAADHTHSARAFDFDGLHLENRRHCPKSGATQYRRVGHQSSGSERTSVQDWRRHSLWNRQLSTLQPNGREPWSGRLLCDAGPWRHHGICCADRNDPFKRLRDAGLNPTPLT